MTRRKAIGLLAGAAGVGFLPLEKVWNEGRQGWDFVSVELLEISAGEGHLGEPGFGLPREVVKRVEQEMRRKANIAIDCAAIGPPSG